MPNNRYVLERYNPNNESQERALSVARRLIELCNDETFLNNGEPAIVIFSGPPGVGKTHLLRSIRGAVNTKHPNAPTFIDDIFSEYAKLSGIVGASSYMELGRFSKNVMKWYDAGRLVVATSNFTLEKIQEELKVVDSIGRASSRLAEMAQRGADVPIIGEDYRNSTNVRSFFS